VKLTYHLPNPADPDVNRKVYERLAENVGKAGIGLNVGLSEDDSLVFHGEAVLTSVEGDNYEERKAHGEEEAPDAG
jgi:hypothetical protein